MSADDRNAVIVTGAKGGVGTALVNEFKSSGCYVIGIDKDKPRESLNCDYYVAADLAKTVSDLDYANKIFGEIRDHLQTRKLYLLVNNAATQVLNKVEDLSRDNWDTTIKTNLLAPFFWIQEFLPELESGKGSVINISSIHAQLSKKNFTAYSTSKAALSGLTRSLALEVGERVRVNAIEPAAVDTFMLQEGFKDNPSGLAELNSFHPTGMIGKPKEISKLALMIADPEMNFLNGACVTLDGGIRSRLYDPG